MAMVYHGGDIYRNKVDIDFSISVNPYPLPYSVSTAMQNALKRAGQYPDLRQERLRSALAGHYGILSEKIVCGNGASELLMAVFHAIRPKQAVLRELDYSGYRRCAEAVGSDTVQTERDGLLNGNRPFAGESLFVVSLPNNPTGKLLAQAVLEQYVHYCKSNNFWLIIDASFLDLTKQAESYWKILLEFVSHYDRCAVLSSFTKCFALPGIRIGYLLCAGTTAERVRRQMPEWNVSVVAEEAGMACLSERAYLAECVGKIAKERKRVSDELCELGLRVHDSDSNFVFFESAVPLYEPLLQKGMLIRDCADFIRGKNDADADGLPVRHHADAMDEKRYHYRIAIRTPKENDRLLQAINECIVA